MQKRLLDAISLVFFCLVFNALHIITMECVCVYYINKHWPNMKTSIVYIYQICDTKTVHVLHIFYHFWCCDIIQNDNQILSHGFRWKKKEEISLNCKYWIYPAVCTGCSIHLSLNEFTKSIEFNLNWCAFAEWVWTVGKWKMFLFTLTCVYVRWV